MEDDDEEDEFKTRNYIYPTEILAKRLEVISEMYPEIKPDEALFEIVWALESCIEAIKIFDGEFFQCPVCYNLPSQDGLIYHKLPSELYN